MSELGYIFEFDKLDAQWFSLRQRRNRIWATCDLNSGQCPDEYAERMHETVRSMASDRLFDFSKCFDESLEKQLLQTDLQVDKLQKAVEKAEINDGTNNVFIDCSTSSTRDVESAVNVLPCVRPSHPIYSQRLGRFIRPSEMWVSQGMWRDDFPCPSAVDEFWKSDTDTQDMAGSLGIKFGGPLSCKTACIISMFLACISFV